MGIYGLQIQDNNKAMKAAVGIKRRLIPSTSALTLLHT